MAGAGFTRRYTANPGATVITLIEGIIILDLPPPGQIQGVNTGVVCLYGEFPDCTNGVAVDNSGNVTSSCNPVQIFSGSDLLAKVGGFDSTIGDFGTSMGNGFVELRNKSFSQLVIGVVNIASSRAVRMWRKLPYNQSLTTPQPVVPMQAAAVLAATPFFAGSNQVNTAGPVNFTGFNSYMSGTDGVVTQSSGTTETFTSASSNFQTVANPNGTVGVQKGDVIVLGAPITSSVVANPTGAAFILPTDTIVFLSPGWTGGYVGYGSATGGLIQFPDTGELAVFTGVTAGSSGAQLTGVTRGVGGTLGATHAVGALIVGLNNVDTYRVNAIPGTTALTLERQDGSSWSAVYTNSFSATGVPWRIHRAGDAESGQGILANAGAYTVPARPLSASAAAATILNPGATPPAVTYNSWNPLSGLQGITDPTIGLIYTSAVQAANAPASASLDALYVNALAIMQSQNLPMANVNLLWAARKSAAIRAGLNTSVNAESGIGIGRMAVFSPDLQSVVSTSQAVASTDPGVGANRSERCIYSWPAVQTFVPEAVNFSIKGADGKLYTNGVVDMPADGWAVAVMSNINPELNPGQIAPPVPAILSPLLGLARNMPVNLAINDYIALKANGVMGIRFDRTVGPVFQSGITTSLVSGQTTIQRRRMADYIEDSIAAATAPLAKQLATQLWQDNVFTEIDSFLNTLLSPDNPALQRINAYFVDPTSGNTPALNSQGIFVWIVSVQTTPTADYMVFQFQIGNGVVIPQQLT